MVYFRNPTLHAARAVLPFVAALTCSCVAVTDLGRFSTQGQTNPNFYDIEFAVHGMDSHVNEYFEARVVDATGVVQTRLVALPLGGDDEAFTMPAAIPVAQLSTLRLEFYADHNHDGVFDLAPVPSDHSWILPLSSFTPDPDGTIRISFDHTTTFETLDADKSFGADALVHIVNAGGATGKRLQLRVADASSKHVVGLYRVPVLAEAAFDVRVKGIIDPAAGTRYQLEATLDDGTDQNVQGFRMEGTSGAGNGLEMSFDPTSSPSASDVLPPEAITK